MMARKKFVLFIVEGETEEISLYKALSNYLDQFLVRFEIVGGDILADYNTTPANVLSIIGDLINDVKRRNFLEDTDVLKVVHLVDTDGVYIDDTKVIENSLLESYTYSAATIECNDKVKCINRNDRKRRLLNKIYSKKSLANCLYEVYYFSCNLDLVLYNQYSLSESDKVRYAKMFEKTFKEDSDKFKKYMTQKTFSTSLNYYDSWNFIKVDENSLKRYSNFNVFLENVVEHNSK